ncbi:hypothetical protein [Microbacterium sp. SSM24]|uniref:hypothetical protein n=1 Tax=Microbacterium sp. SSM24 TaxID=2991714 RepID=UPI0022265820|nr:hypothetical protein [Microbacterium sp. SSM24]MCW3493131.1 hypothetical protein [Microbacterium sp. SSM24]
MTEPQVWTLIGVFAAAMLGVLTLVSTLFINVVRSEIGGLRSEFRSEFRRFEDKLDNLDRDVQALMRHTFGIDRD